MQSSNSRLHQVHDQHPLESRRGPDGAGTSQSSIELPPTRVKLRGFSLRLGPVSESHLDELIQLEGEWPPILVSHDDFTLIDGHYRVIAARRLGLATISAHLFRGTPEAAYLEALRRNTREGLPLSLREREYAAYGLLAAHPDWSDRWVAKSCALAPGTVRRLREDSVCPTGQDGQLDKRLGRDSRQRPANSALTRIRITKALQASPASSLRQVARLVGCSPETVRAVRHGLTAEVQRPEEPDASLPDRLMVRSGRLGKLAESAYSSTPEASAFSVWFAQTDVDSGICATYATGVPVSRVYEIADEARRRSDVWATFAKDLERRAKPASVRA